MNIHKSDQDSKLYSYIVLSNKLRVLLIQDPKPTANQRKAAASLSVGVGSSSDPPQVQGIAHFLEHMMSMGCKAYPNENDYSTYLDSHGGSENAWTDFETTLYHQEIEQEALEESLKRMAALFIAPLLRRRSFEREMKAVDSEFKQSLESDSDRLQELWAYTTINNHPFKRFTWGNLESLKLEPEANGVDIGHELQTFYSTYYSANLMALCVVSASTLQDMETMVRKYFTNIPNTNSKRPKHPKAGPPWILGQGLGQIYKIIPVKDHTHEIHMTFPTPSLLISETLDESKYALPSSSRRDGYLKRFDELMAHVIGYEGKGSLLSWLKRRKYATALEAGCGSGTGGMENSTCCSLFTVGIVLTELGLKEWKTVVLAVMYCIGLLRGECSDLKKEEKVERGDTSKEKGGSNSNSNFLKNLFEQLKMIGEASHRYESETDPCDLSEAFGELLQHPGIVDHPEDLLFAGHGSFCKPCIWDSNQFKTYCQKYFVPENCRLDIISSSYEIDNEKKSFLIEPRFGTKYSVTNVDKIMLNDMRQVMLGNSIDSERLHFSCSVSGEEKQAWTIVNNTTSLSNNNFDHSNMNRSSESYFSTITLPSPNPFVPEDFTLRIPRPIATVTASSNFTSSSKTSTGNPPAVVTIQQIINTPILKIWFKPDDQFYLPKLDARFEFHLPNFRNSIHNIVHSEIMLRLIRAEICEFVYDAEMAELHIHISIASSNDTFLVFFSGFNHRMTLFCESCGDRIRQVISEQKYSDDNLANVLAALRRRYSNRHKDPSNACHFWRLTFLTTNPINFSDFNPTTNGIYELEAFSKSAFNAYLRQLGCGTSDGGIVVHGLVHGNQTEKEAQELAFSFLYKSGLVEKDINNGTEATNCSYLSPHVSRIVCLPSDISINIRMPTENSKEKNSVIEVYFQGSGNNVAHCPWNKELAIARVLNSLLDEPCFDTLRTKEQLGYTVECSYKFTAGVVGFFFSIISSTHTTVYLEERIEYFINCCATYFRMMSEEEYIKRRKALHTSLSVPHTNLDESADELFSAITERHFCFSSEAKIAESVLSVSKDQMLEWFEKYVLNEGRKKLVVCVDCNKKDGNEIEKKEIDESSSDGSSCESEGSGSESEDSANDSDENDAVFPINDPHIKNLDSWKSVAVVELTTNDVASYKATLELLPKHNVGTV